MNEQLQKRTQSFTDAAIATFGREKFDLLRTTICQDLTPAEMALFVEVCTAKRLDPFARQIHALKRRSKKRVKHGNQWVDEWVEKMNITTGIDGFRVIAQRTGQYEGQSGPFWCGEDGVWRDVWLAKTNPSAAKVAVMRKGFREPLVGIALWEEYAQRRDDGQAVGTWASHPSVMLAKCFDEETEVLTDQGFLLFSKVGTAKILQVTEEGLGPVAVVPFVQPYQGNMVTLDSDDLNFCVTPNHDMVTTSGKVEAGLMYEMARARPKFWIPRCVKSSREDFNISDESIQLAAIFIADGYATSDSSWTVSVSRQYKVRAIEEIGGWTSRRIIGCAGDEATGASGRVIQTTKDKEAFLFPLDRIDGIVDDKKNINIGTILMMSTRQARIFVDMLLMFDGADNGAGTRRFFTSNEKTAGAFEVACVQAGYACSIRRERFSDLSDRPNYCITVSDRNEIPVIRWARDHHGIDHGRTAERTGLTMTPSTGSVWCVTVPSGKIVVRRHGFSMVCGNCAEAVALRRAFPEDLSGLYVSEELKTEDVADEMRSRMSELDSKMKELPEPQEAQTEEPAPAEAPEPVKKVSATEMLINFKKAVDACGTHQQIEAVVAKWAPAMQSLPPRATAIAAGYAQSKVAEMLDQQVDANTASAATMMNDLAKE